MMNYFNKQRLLIWALIILVVINVTAIGTIIYQNYRFRQHTFPPKFDLEKFDQNVKDRFDEHEFFLRKELDLNKDQMTKFREYRRAYFQETRLLMDSLRTKRKQLMKELSNDEPDKAQLMRLSDEIGALHAELKVATVKHFLQMKKTIGPQQQHKLNRMFMDMMNNDRMHRGKSPAHGRHRHGRKNNR